MKGVGLTAFSPMVSCAQSAISHDFHMPDEGEPHAATWMAFGATAQAWGTTGSYGLSRTQARRDLMRIAVNIARFEPVKMLVSPNDMRAAQTLLAQERLHANAPIELMTHNVDDLWMRDTGPVFVKDEHGQLHGVDFNFNGWGQDNTGAKGWARDPEKARNGIQTQSIKHDKTVVDFILKQTQTPKISTWLVLEGGGIEVDGQGTAICTESCILNPNRNPNRSKTEVEAELARVLGVRKVIWLKGVKAQDITDGHVDFYARFVAPTQVVYGLDNNPDSPEYEVTRANEAILKSTTDALGRPLRITPLIAPDEARVAQAVMARNLWSDKIFNADGFTAGYIGFYVANQGILLQQFGDEVADKAAFDTLQGLYPQHQVVQIAADGLANGGGTIHCATQQQPKVN
ncbi:MAG: agmatine deiminase family protein [Formosimonas sp.]